MKISDLQVGMSGVSVTAEVVDISEAREVNTMYGKKKVADAIIEDDTGSIKLSLWENRIKEISVGDKIKITGAFVTEFKNELQLNIPRTGKIEKI